MLVALSVLIGYAAGPLEKSPNMIHHSKRNGSILVFGGRLTSASYSPMEQPDGLVS